MNEIVAYNVGVGLAQLGRPLSVFLTMPADGLRLILAPDQLAAREALGHDSWGLYVRMGHDAGLREMGR